MREVCKIGGDVALRFGAACDFWSAWNVPSADKGSHWAWHLDLGKGQLQMH